MKKYFLYSLALVGLLTIANSITIAQTANSNNEGNQANQGVSAVDDVFDDYAQSKTPQISTINVIQAGDNPLLEVKGVGFGKNANQVKVIVNDNGVLITPSQVKNKKLLVQIPNSNLCSGDVNVRVIVGTTASNLSSFQYQKSAPIIYSLAPTHAQAGSVIEIAGDNLACNAADNLVTVNDVAVNVLSVNADKLTVRIPETFASGPVKIRLTVGTQASLAKDFIVDGKTNTNDSPTGGTGNDKLIFISSAPSGASFAPMFAIREMVKDINAPKGEVPLWDMNFYGTHQAIIDLPFSVEGMPQKALLTINCREVPNVFGNFTGEKERFVYALISFPRNPEKLYHPENNGFFWGACSIATESNPSGGIIFNSLGRAGAGIDSFEISKTASSNSKATMTFRLIAPDLGVYEPYGINYSLAGNGVVKLPKVLTITVEMDQIQPNLPASKFLTGKVTYKDFANGSMTTDNATFSNTFSITDVPEFGLGIFR